MKNLFKTHPTKSHNIPSNPTIISLLLYIYINWFQYDPTFPKQTNLTVGRVGWSAWEINQWIESKLASR